MKLLFTTTGGLNDTIGGILDCIKTFQEDGLDTRDIHVTHPVYKSLDTYFNFKTITYIDTLDPKYIKDFHVVRRNTSGHLTRKFSQEFIAEHISIKDEFIQQAPKYPDYIGIHLRTIFKEVIDVNVNRASIERWVYCFNRIYKKEEKYVFFSDSDIWSEIFQNRTNVEFCLPKTTINVFDSVEKNKLRNIHLKETILNICSMASCKELRVVTGYFACLVRLLPNYPTIKAL